MEVQKLSNFSLEHNVNKQQKNGVTYAWTTEWIKKLEPEQRWRLYWRQQKLMENFIEPELHFYEIGVGNGFTANYLRTKGIKVTTVDIDPEKQPDIVANIVDIDWAQHRFDHLMAFETFEHIPFNEFVKALRGIRAVCDGCVFMSVPETKRILLEASIILPRFGRVSLIIPWRRKAHIRHFWELGRAATTRKVFYDAISAAGYYVDHEFKFYPQTFFRLKPR